MQWKIEETLKPEHKQPPAARPGVLGNHWGVLSHRGAMGYVLWAPCRARACSPS